MHTLMVGLLTLLQIADVAAIAYVGVEHEANVFMQPFLQLPGGLLVVFTVKMLCMAYLAVLASLSRRWPMRIHPTLVTITLCAANVFYGGVCVWNIYMCMRS